jgi:acyl dehydratase
MSKVILHLADLPQWVGKEVAVSDWLVITQARIDKFAEAAGDFQWIHVDVERAAAETPYGGTIAHGFLTLSVLSQLLGDTIEFDGRRMGINYGVNRLRFTGPVPAGSRVRARFTLGAVEPIEGGVQTAWHVTVEREGEQKPALVTEWLIRHYA